MASVSSSSNGKKLIRIDISADTVCPWCFVGKKNFDKAIGLSNDSYNFEIKWHPFLLMPSAPKEGVNKKEFFRNKFGPRAEQIEAPMSEIFKGLGMDYDMSGLTDVSNYFLGCIGEILSIAIGYCILPDNKGLINNINSQRNLAVAISYGESTLATGTFL